MTREEKLSKDLTSNIMLLKVWDPITEIGYGIIIELTVSDRPIKHEDGERTRYTRKAKTRSGDRTVDYLITEGLEHYGPRLRYGRI